VERKSVQTSEVRTETVWSDAFIGAMHQRWICEGGHRAAIGGDLVEVVSIRKVVLKREPGMTQIPWWTQQLLVGTFCSLSSEP